MTPLKQKLKLLLGQFYASIKRLSLSNKILLGGLTTIWLTGLAVFSLVVLVWSGALGKLPSYSELSEVENPAATEVYSADSVLLGRYFIQERSTILGVPKSVEQALLATEDVRFYDHHGIDILSLIRVLVKSIVLQNESSGGGSTITQQLVKNLYPRQDYKFMTMPVNKIREMLIAWRLENIYDKKTILILYLNTIPFADNTFGIEAASQRFFSVPTKSLNLEQAAVLVGMLKATHLYNPRLFPARAKQRRNVVLSQMVKYGFLEEGQSTKLQAAPLNLKYNLITHHKGLAPYFRYFLRKELLEWCRTHTKANGEPYNLFTDGLKVYTTLDSRIQKLAEEAVEVQMAVLQKRFDQHWASRTPWHNQPQVLSDAIRRSDRYKNLKEQGLSEKEIDKVMKQKVLMEVFTWEGEKEMKMSPIDSIKHYLKFLNAGFVAMEPTRGAVLAWVGGINHYYFQFDHIKTSTKRQVGSTFKPIVYAAALEAGADPCEFISSEKTTYTNIEDMDSWTPQNTDGNYDLKYSMEGALAYSVNTVSVKILEQAGIKNAISLAQRMGIESKMPSVPSLALGVADISMIEMVTAYASFVNKGRSVKPHYITRITTKRGEVLEEFKFNSEDVTQAMSAETAEMVVHMLQRTVNEGTAGKLRWEYGVYNDLGGKTGTTQSNADGWFISVSPKLVVGSWVGADDPRIRFRSTSLGQGSSTALPIVAKFYQKLNKDSGLAALAQARFPRFSTETSNLMACPLYKSDLNFWETLFGVPDEPKEVQRDFGKPSSNSSRKRGFLKKFFKKKTVGTAAGFGD
jgi:penicillin-binding protein 1A